MANISPYDYTQDVFDANQGYGTNTARSSNTPILKPRKNLWGLYTSLMNKRIPGIGISAGNIGLGAETINQLASGIKGSSSLSSSKTDIQELIKDIQGSALANPIYLNYLNADQRKILRQIQKGTYSSKKETLGDALSNITSSGIPNALLGAGRGFLLSGGNPLGALIGGGGSLLSSGLEGANRNNQEKINELQALYEVLSAAEQDYNTMRRPSDLGYANLQNRYSSLLR